MPSRVRRSHVLIVTACLAAAVSAPGSALAQSAGDNQYQDPLAGGTQTAAPSAPAASTPQLTPSAGTGATSGSSGTAGTAKKASSTPSGTSTSPTQASATSLPNTGVDGRIIAGLGAGLLLCGVGLRLRTARERF